MKTAAVETRICGTIRRTDGPLRAQDFARYGREVLSPAGGRVVRAVDCQPDWEAVGTFPAADGFLAKLERALGNYVAIDHGEGVWSLLGHLLRGALRVHVGASVDAGQAVGRLGNSGFSSGPHLHVQLMDSPDPLTASPLSVALDVEGQTYAPQAEELITD